MSWTQQKRKISGDQEDSRLAVNLDLDESWYWNRRVWYVKQRNL